MGPSCQSFSLHLPPPPPQFVNGGARELSPTLSPLHMAAARGHVACVEALLRSVHGLVHGLARAGGGAWEGEESLCKPLRVQPQVGIGGTKRLLPVS